MSGSVFGLCAWVAGSAVSRCLGAEFGSVLPVFSGGYGPVPMARIPMLCCENGKKPMKIRINSLPATVSLGDATKPITKEERDRLFDVVVTLTNFADAKGLGAVSDKLEEALDMLLASEDAEATEFATSRQVGWASSRREMPVERRTARMVELKKATRRRLSALS